MAAASSSRARRLARRGALLAILCIAFIGGLALVCGPSRAQAQALAQAPSGRPDVALRLVFPRDPALVLSNRSNDDARAISWTLSLWNVSRSPVGDKLAIAPGSYELVKAHDESGAIRLFDDERLAGAFKPGDRLFGSASVQCVPCGGGHTYVVSIIWGEGGWFAEVKGGGAILVPADLRKPTLDDYFASLDALSANAAKTPIADEPAPKAGIITRRIDLRAAVQNDKLYIMNVGPAPCVLRGLQFGDGENPAASATKLEPGAIVAFPLAEALRAAPARPSAVIPLRVLLQAGAGEKFTMRAALEIAHKGAALDIKVANSGVFYGGW
jgi:hypothetical protein